MMAATWGKSLALNPVRSGVTTTSASAREALTFSCMSRVSTWDETRVTEPRAPRSSGGVETFTAIRTSAPMLRAMSTGRLRTIPPSTRRRPSSSTGVNAPGTDMLARIASARSPSERTTISPVTMSVATARNGIGRSSKRCTSTTRMVNVLRRKSIFCPATSPEGRTSFHRLSPNSKGAR